MNLLLHYLGSSWRVAARALLVSVWLTPGCGGTLDDFPSERSDTGTEETSDATLAFDKSYDATAYAEDSRSYDVAQDAVTGSDARSEGKDAGTNGGLDAYAKDSRSYDAARDAVVRSDARSEAKDAGESKAPTISRAGLGCEDLHCIWIIGDGFQSGSRVAVRPMDGWDVIGVFPAAIITHETASTGEPVIKFRIPADSQYDEVRRKLKSVGIRAWVTNPDGKSSNPSPKLVILPPVVGSCDTGYPAPGESCASIPHHHSSGTRLWLDVGSRSNQPIRKVWYGANGAYPFAEFRPDMNMPANWMKKKFPFFTHIRFGNFLFGHCNVSGWRQGLGLQEIINSDLSPNFAQTNQYMQLVLDSGVKPQITLTGTPKAVAGSGWTCSSFGHIATPPRGNIFDWQNKVVGNLAKSFIAEFGANEVRSWIFTGWTEPDCACHFKGTMSDMADIIKMSINVLRHPTIDIPFRLGNFVATGGMASDLVELLKKKKGVNFARDLNGVGLSLYVEEEYGVTADSVASRIAGLRNILSRHGLGNLPVYIDETGILSIRRGSSFYKTAGSAGEPSLYGASMLASMVEAMIESNVSGINFWHRSFYISVASRYRLIDRWVKTANYNVVALLDPMKNLKVVPLTGEESSATYGKIRGIGGHDSSSNLTRLFLYRHSSNISDKTKLKKTICFKVAPNRVYQFKLAGIDETKGSAWDHLFPNHSHLDHYSGGKYHLSSKIPLSEASLAFLKTKEDHYTMSEGEVTVGAGGSFCYTFAMRAHSVYLAELKAQ